MDIEEVESLYLDTDILEVYKEGLSKGVQNLDSNNEETSEDFGTLGKNNIYKNGLNQIQRGISETRDTLFNCLKVNEEYVERFIDLENKGKAIVQNIDIPTDFAVSASTRNTTYSDTSISKQDGKSIKEGTYGIDSTTEEVYDEEKEELKDILKEENGEEKEAKKTNVIKEEIVDTLETVEDSVDKNNESKVEKQIIGNINESTNKDTLEEEKKVDVKEKVIGNIKKEKEDNAVVEEIKMEENQPVIKKIQSEVIEEHSEPQKDEDFNNEEIKEEEENDNQS